MDKKKLADIIDSVDDRYLRESEKPNGEGIVIKRRIRIAVEASCIAALAIVIIIGIVLRLNKGINNINEQLPVAVESSEKPEYTKVTVDVPIVNPTGDVTGVNPTGDTEPTDIGSLVTLPPEECEKNLKELYKYDMPFFQLDGKKRSDLISMFGMPVTLEKADYWGVEIDGLNRYFRATYDHNENLISLYKTKTYKAVMISDKSAAIYEDGQKIDTGASFRLPNKDKFGNAIDLVKGDCFIYEEQVDDLWDESIAAMQINIICSVKKLAHFSDEEIALLRNGYVIRDLQVAERVENSYMPEKQEFEKWDIVLNKYDIYINSFRCGYLTDSQPMPREPFVIYNYEMLGQARMDFGLVRPIFLDSNETVDDCREEIMEEFDFTHNVELIDVFDEMVSKYPISEYIYVIQYVEAMSGSCVYNVDKLHINGNQFTFELDDESKNMVYETVTDDMSGFAYFAAVPRKYFSDVISFLEKRPFKWKMNGSAAFDNNDGYVQIDDVTETYYQEEPFDMYVDFEIE